MKNILKDLKRRDHKRYLGGLDVFKYIGPGLLVTVGFIDPGNWASNFAAGSEFGYSLLWVVTLSTCKFFVAPTEYDEKTRKKRWKEDSPERMLELADVLEALDDFSLENQEAVVMKWIEDKGYHLGNIMNAFRLTLVGEGKGPHMFDISAVLGKEETLRRIRRAVEVLK